MLSIKNMVKMYQSPPEEFKDVILNHFGKAFASVKKLVEACRRMLDGEEEREEDKEIKALYAIHNNPSRGFLLSVTKILSVVKKTDQ